jgi:hypothetical protein
MVRSLLVVAALLARSGTAGAQSANCPVNKPGGWSTPPAANCEVFCSGKCAFHPDYSPGKPVNLTLFRLTANKMLSLGAGNKDTGDAPGDVGFYMQRFMQLVNCTAPFSKHGCFLDEDPVVQQFVIEADGQWGPYLKCNPIDGPDGSPNLAAPFLCNYGNQAQAGCACDRSNKTVGVDPAHHISLKDCMAAKRGPQISCLFGGYWYSTPAAGQCTGSQRIGDGSGCTWRVISQPKTVNDTGCIAERMLLPLYKHNKACFDQLPEQPPNPQGAGFGTCFKCGGSFLQDSSLP